jgi:hypothetical protein
MADEGGVAGGVARHIAFAFALAAVVTTASVAALSAEKTALPTVSCDQIIGRVGSGRAAGYRVVLGVVSAPPAYLPQVVPTGNRPWAFWRKAGLVVRGGAGPVVVSVPRAWRARAAITWGNTAIVSMLRIERCPGLPPKVWNAYAGGFYLRSRSACVPLTFRVGRRAKTVRFGLAKRC